MLSFKSSWIKQKRWLCLAVQALSLLLISPSWAEASTASDLLERVFAPGTSVKINNITSIRDDNKTNSGTLLGAFCKSLNDNKQLNNRLLFHKISGDDYRQPGETTDNENSISVYGKIVKIYNLLTNMSSNDSAFNLEEKISNKIENLKTGSYSFTNLISSINDIGTPTDDPATVPFISSPTIFSQLNAILDSLRNSLNVEYAFNNEVSPEQDPCSLLQAITQAGSRGFNSTLIKKIIPNTENTKVTIDKDKATAVLQSDACWETIFGTSADEANPIGTICGQIKAANISEALNKNFEGISTSWDEISSNIPQDKLTKVYSLLVPTLKGGKEAPLDYLGDVNEQDVCITVESTDNLTLQECLTYLLSGATLENKDGSESDSAKSELVTRISAICQELLKLLTNCCGEAAQWAVTLQKQLACADTDHLLTALQAFNKQSGSADEAIGDSSTNNSPVTTDRVTHDSLSSYLETLTKKLDSEAAASNCNGDCSQLVNTFGDIVTTLKKRVAECDNPIGLLTSNAWMSAIEAFANSTTTLKERLTTTGICCPDCQKAIGANGETIKTPLKALAEFALSLPKALQAKALGTLAANLASAEAALKDFVEAPDAGQRSSLTTVLKSHSPPNDDEVSPLRKLNEEVSFLNETLGGNSSVPDVLEGDSLDYACVQTEKIISTLDLIFTDLNILKTNAEPISDVPFGEALQQYADVLEGFQETWENLEKELTEVSSAVQEKLLESKARLGNIIGILKEIATSYGTCCKEKVADIKSLAHSAATLETYLSQVQKFLMQDPPPSLPKADDYKDITFDQNSSGLTETLATVNSTIWKLCSKLSENFSILTSPAKTEILVGLPCAQIETYTNLALNSLEALPALLEKLRECVLSRIDTTLPAEVRANLQSLVDQLAQQTLPTISCDYCSNKHSVFETKAAGKLNNALGNIKKETTAVIEALQDKCCLQEGRLLRQLSDEVMAFSSLIADSSADDLARNIISIQDTTLQVQVEVLTETLRKEEAILETHNNSESLREIINALSEFRKGWAETFNKKNVESISLPDDLLLCNSKRESLKTINKNFSSLAENFNAISSNIQKIDHTHNALAVNLIKSIKGVLTALQNKLPSQSLCALCNASSELPSTLSAKKLLSDGINHLNSALENMIDALDYHTQCDNLSKNCLAFSTAFEEYKTSLIEFITSKDEAFLDTVLKQLSLFNSTLEGNSDAVSMLNNLAKELSEATQFNTTKFPVKNPSSTDTVPQHGDTLVNTVTKIAECLTDLASEIQRLKDSWEINPPRHSTSTEGKLSELIQFISGLKNNFIGKELFSPSCPLFTPLLQETENISMKDYLGTKLDNTGLLANLTALLDAYKALRIAPLVSALRHLNKVLNICSDNPVTAVQIAFSTDNSHDVPILCTTRPNSVLQLWQETFATLSQNLQTDSSKAAASIEALADKIKELHKELSGKVITFSSTSYFFEDITSAREALAKQITQTEEIFSKLLAQIRTQPFATNKELSEAFRITSDFLETIKQELAKKTPSGGVDTEGLNDVFKAIESIQLGTENFETGNCSQAFSRTLSTFSRNVEIVCVGLTALRDLVTPQSNSLTDISAFAASMDRFAGSTSYFLSNLVPLPDEVLCDETYATERINELNAGLSELATALGFSLTTETDPFQEVLSVEAILASLQETFCGKESKLHKTFTSLIGYAQESYEKGYNHATVESLFRILSSFREIYDSLNAVKQRFAEEGTVLLCRERAESSASTVKQIEAIAGGLGETNSLMEDFYNAIRMRFWNPYQDYLHTLRIQVDEHASFLEFLQREIKVSNEALKNNGDAEATANYSAIIKAIESLDTAFENVSSLGINLSDISSNDVETALQAIQGAMESLQTTDGESQEKKPYSLPYHDELTKKAVTETDGNGTFETLRKVFDLTEHTYNPINEEEKAPLILIQEDLDTIHEALKKQCEALNTLAFFPVGTGNGILQERIQKLASFFDATTPATEKTGLVSKVFITIFTTVSQLVEKFENLSPRGSPRLLESSLPTQDDIEASFTNLNEALMNLADRFDPEQCPLLAQTYVQLAREIETLAEHLSSLSEGTEFLKSIPSLLNTTIESLNEIEADLKTYLEKSQNSGINYCASSYIYPPLQKIAQAIRELTQSQSGVNSSTNNGQSSDLIAARKQLIQSLRNLTSALRSQTDRIQTFGLETPWPPEKLASLNTLISYLEPTENTEDPHTIPDSLKGILKTLNNRPICTLKEKETSNESQTFLGSLIDEETPVFKAEVIHLKDIVQQLMFDQKVEAAWLKILHGTSMLNKLLGDAKNPLEQLQALTQNLKTLASSLQSPLQNYLETALPSEPQIEALENIASLLASNFDPPYSALPFTAASWEEDVTRTLEEVEGFAFVLSKLNQNFQQSLFTKQPDLEAELVELIQYLNVLADVCQTKPANTSLSPDVHTQARTRLQEALTLIAEELQALLSTLHDSPVEQKLRFHVAGIQAMFEHLPDIAQIFVDELKGIHEDSRKTKAEALYKQLQSSLFVNPQDLSLNEVLSAFTATWALKLDWFAFLEKAASVQGAAYTLTVAFLKLAAAPTAAEFPVTEEPSLTTLAPVQIPVSLEHIRQAFTSLSEVLSEGLGVMGSLTFDSDRIAALIAADAPLHLLASLRPALLALAETLCKAPGSTYDEVTEDAERLRDVAAVCLDLDSILRTAQNLIDVQAALPWYRLLEQLRILATQTETFTPTEDLTFAGSLFAKLASFAEAIRSLDNTPEAASNLLKELSATLDKLGLPLPDDSHLEPNPSFLQDPRWVIEAEIEATIQRIQSPVSTWTDTWLSTPYVLNEALIRNVETFHGALPYLAYNWKPLQGTLEAFLSRLKTPTCCERLNTRLFKIYENLLPIGAFFEALAILPQLPSLEKAETSTLTAPSEAIKILTTLLERIQNNLSSVTINSCQDASWLQKLEGIAINLTDFATPLNAIATYLNLEVGTPTITPLPSLPPCEQTDLLISRLLSELDVLTTNAPKFLDIIKLKPGESRLYFPDFIGALESLSQALGNFETFLEAIPSEAPCPYHSNTNDKLTCPCPLHNTTLHAQTKSALVSSVGKLKTFIDNLIAKLEIFKYSRVGEIIHQLKLEASATQVYLEAFVPKNGEGETAPPPYPTLDSAALSQLKEALEKQDGVWQTLGAAAPGWENNRQDLFEHEETLRTLLPQALKRNAAFQALTGKILSSESNVSYGPEQIKDDLTAIQAAQNTIVETLTGPLYEACTKGSPRFVNAGTAAAVSALEGLYETLEGASQHFKLSSSEDTTTLPSIEEALAAFIPKTIPLLTCHRLAFALSHKTCCKPYLDQIDTVTEKYNAATKALSDLASAHAPTPDALSREAALKQIQQSLDAIKAALTSNEGQLNTIFKYVGNIQTTTCFTDEGPSPKTALEPALDTLSTNLDSLPSSLNAIAQARQTLYGLSVLSPQADWHALPASIEATLPYYQESVATTWATLNESLRRQVSLLSDLASALQTLHESDALCFLNGAQYGEKLKAFNSLSEILDTSVQALEVYNDRCCTRAIYHIVRITKYLSSSQQDLSNLQGLSELRFRNTTIDKAEACCRNLNTELQELTKTLNSAPAFDPHALATLQNLISIEEIIARMVQAIADYNNASVLPVKDLTPLPSFKGALADLITAATSIPNILNAWHEALEGETGEDSNERCYSRAVEPIIDSLEALQQSFESRTLSSTAPHAQALKGLWQTLADSLAENGNIITPLKKIDTLLKTPTCCVLRLQNLENVYNGLQLIVPSIEKALEAYPNAKEKLSESSIDKLNEAAKSLQKAIPARNEAFRCQGPKTAAQANSIDTAFQSLGKTIDELATALQQAADQKNKTTNAEPTTNQNETINEAPPLTACQQLESPDKAIVGQLEGITKKLEKLIPSTTEGANSGTKGARKADPDTETYHLSSKDYNGSLTEKLRDFLTTLSNICTKLHGAPFDEGQTVKEFCEYRNDQENRQSSTQENKEKCSAVGYIIKLNDFIKSFRNILSYVEGKAYDSLTSKFYQLARAVQRFVVRIQQMFEISEAGLDIQQLSSLIKGFEEIGTTLNGITSSFEKAEAFNSGDIESYDVYEQMAIQLDTTSATLETILENLKRKPYDSDTHDQPGQSLPESWKAIQLALTSLATTFESRQSNIPVYQRALIETWEKIHSNLISLENTLNNRATHSPEGASDKDTYRSLYECIQNQEAITPISLEKLKNSQFNFLTALKAYDPCSALDNSFFKGYATTLNLLNQAFTNSASIFENEIDELKFTNGLNAIADALEALNNTVSQPTSIEPSKLPALVQLGVLCHYDEAKLKAISEVLKNVENAVFIFPNSLIKKKQETNVQENNSQEEDKQQINNQGTSNQKEGSQETGNPRTKLYEEIATEASKLKDKINKVLEGAKTCHVRDYHPQSIAAVQNVLDQVENLTNGLSSFIKDRSLSLADENNPTTFYSFGAVTYCSFCYKKAGQNEGTGLPNEQDKEQTEETKLPSELDSDALNSLSTTMSDLQEVLGKTKTYLEHQFCSHLTANLFVFAQNLETLATAISNGKPAALEELDKLEITSQNKTTEEGKLSAIIKKGLNKLQNVFSEEKQNTQGEADTQKNQIEICSQRIVDLSECLKYWNDNILKPIYWTFTTNSNLLSLSDISTKNPCTCDSLPEAVEACFAAVSRTKPEAPGLNAALTKFTSKLNDNSFENFSSLCDLDEALEEFIQGLLELAPQFQSFQFCPYGHNLNGFFVEAASSTKSPFKSALESLKENLDTIHKIIEKNCNKEIIGYLHNANIDLGILTNALKDVLNSQGSKLKNAWTEAQENNKFTVNIEKINNAEKEIYATLLEIEKLKSDPGHCSFFRNPNAAKPIQDKTREITNAFLSLVGQNSLGDSPATPVLQEGDTVSKEWYTYHSHIKTLQEHLKTLIEQGTNQEEPLYFSDQKNESKIITNLFLSISSLLQKKAQIFKQLYTKWTANRNSEGTQGPPCPECSDTLCQALPQLSEKITELGDIVSQVASAFSGSCCTVAFKALVPATEGMGKVVAYLQALTKSEQLEALFGKALTIFDKGWSKVKDTLQKLSTSATTSQENKCKISSLISVFTEFAQAFDNPLEGTSNKGLLQGFEALFESNGLPSPTFMAQETFEYECGELEAILHLFIRHTTALKDVLNHFVELSPLLLDDEETQPEDTWDEKLKLMYDATLAIVMAIRGIGGEDNLTPQFCPNCPNQYVAQVLPEIIDNLQDIAKTFLELRPSARGSQCCSAFGQRLALTQEYLQTLFKWADNQLQTSPVAFAKKIIDNEGELGNELIEKLKRVVDTLGNILAAQQKASDSKALSDALSRPLCSTTQLISSLDALNKALGSLCDTMKLEVSPTPDSEIRDCKTIATNFRKSLSNLQSFCRTLSNKSKSSLIINGLQSYIEKFADLFTQGATTLEKICLNASFQPLCSHCTLDLRSPTDALDQIAQSLTTCLEKLSEHGQTKTDLQDILNAMASINQALSSFVELPTLQPFFQSSPSKFQVLFTTWTTNLATIFGQISNLQGGKRLTTLSNIAKEIQNIQNILSKATQEIPKDQLQGIELNLATAEEVFKKTFSSQVAEAGEALQNLAEFCLYEGIRADESTKSAARSFAAAIGDFISSADKEEGNPSLTEIAPYLTTSWTFLSSAAQQLVDALSAQDTSHVSQVIAPLTKLLLQTAQALESARPALPSCNLDSYLPAWTDFFNAFTPLAHAARNLKVSLEATGGSLTETFIQTILSPFTDLRDAAYKLNKACTGQNLPSEANLTVSSSVPLEQAYHNLAGAFIRLSETLLGFVQAARDFHVQNDLLVDLQGPVNLRVILPVLLDSWKDLLSSDSEGKTPLPSRPEHALITTALAQLSSLADPISILVTKAQAEVRLTPLRATLDTATLAPDGRPVMVHLFTPAYDERGLPCQHPQGTILAAHDSLLTRTTETMHAAELLRRQIL